MPSDTSPAAFEASVYRKVTWRLIPVLFSCYILAYVDRVNVGFAKLSMTTEPWFSEAVFATGAGVFFIGYFFFEVPGNIILHRVGARLWIARIMVGWGIVSMLMALSYSKESFYWLRFLLGIAEAGFFPGIILYLTYWYPREHRARIVALFMTAVAVAGIIGGPLSGWILNVTEGWHGARNWQWLFILEGIPTLLLGCAVPFILADRSEKAKWLTAEEKAILVAKLDTDQRRKTAEGHHAHHALDAFRSPRVWLCCAIYFGIVAGTYGVSFWLPQIIKDTLTKDPWEVGLYSAIPWACAAVGMIFVSRHSDRTGERRWHVGLSALVSAAAFAFAASSIPGLPPGVVLAILALAVTGVMSAISCFWAIPTAILSGSAAAAGIAWINSVGNLAGYVSPEMVGWLKKHYDMNAALCGLAALLAMAGLLVICTIRPSPPTAAFADA
jgi:D-galactonate transporter